MPATVKQPRVPKKPRKNPTPIKALIALTTAKVQANRERASIFRVKEIFLLTGRYHQIGVELAVLPHPIILIGLIY